MGGDVLRLARPLQHEQLRQDGDRLEEDGEGPQDFDGSKTIIEYESKDCGWPNKVFDSESVNSRVM